ncbi:unnamed protein product [Ilex paraguariensis]|uniref:Uncharacterized protein n=1 Tax=Ilex paraguariensis TaxID=185542 RepID=A0ABC8TG85_9AQUA
MKIFDQWQASLRRWINDETKKLGLVIAHLIGVWCEFGPQGPQPKRHRCRKGRVPPPHVSKAQAPPVSLWGPRESSLLAAETKTKKKMASNLGRLFTSAIELSKPPKLSLSFGRSELSISAIRLIWSSTQRKQSHQENPKEPEGEVSENSEKLESEDDDTRNGDAEDEDMRTVMAFK